MAPTDAGAPAGGFSGAQILARLGGASPRFSIGQGKPPRPAVVRELAHEPPAPPADGGRPLAELEATMTAAREVVNSILERRLLAAEQLESADRRIEAGRESLDPGKTAADRAERARLSGELEEFDTLVERASAVHDRASQAWQAGQYRETAAAIGVKLAALVERAQASDAALEAAVNALLDAEDERYALIAEAERTQAELDGLPAAYRAGSRTPETNVNGVMVPLPGYYPAPIRFDRSHLPSCQVPYPRVRRWQLGL